MKPNYYLTHKATEDLKNIWNYSKINWSEKIAENYFLNIIEDCERIVSNPNIGRNYSFISNDLFGFRSNQHIIFYKKTKHFNIEVIRILHSKMDIKQSF